MTPPRAIAAVLLASAGCDAASRPAEEAAAAPATWFREESRQRGLVFEHTSGAADDADPRLLLPEIMGPGCALFDMDGDGDLDAYLVQAGRFTAPAAERPTDRLFENRGEGTFGDVTAASGIDERGYGMGVACGDHDGDGDTDLYVTNVGRNTLLRNEGGGRFADVTDTARVGDTNWGTSAAFLDFDADGDLDLFVCNYVHWSPATERDCVAPRGGADYCSPRSYAAPTPAVLYRNEGDGTFTDVSKAAGLHAAFGNGLGVAPGDFDGDERADLYVANDATENQLWIQQADGTFRDEALARGCAMDRAGTAKAGMGVAAADVDDDADTDLLVVNLVDEGDSFYRNEGGRFADRTATVGLAAASRPFTRFGVGLVDFDHDGRLDLFVANGHVARPPVVRRPDDPYAEPNQLFRGTAEGRFDEVTPRGGTDPVLVETSRGAAFGDVDGDGALDVLVANRDGPARVLRNVTEPRGRWAILRAVERSGADALGARVTCRVGSRTVTRDVVAAWSYCSSNDPRVHLGLAAETVVRDVRVRWVGGTTESFGDLPAGRVHELRRGAGTAVR